MSWNLPPLPQRTHGFDAEPLFTANQMRAYAADRIEAQAKRIAELEGELARVTSTLAASCVEEREQLWEATAGGGCSRAIAAEAALAHVRAEQEQPLKQRPDFIAGYLDGLADGQRIAERDAQPVSGAADPVGIPAGEQTGPVSAAPTLTDIEIWMLVGDKLDDSMVKLKDVLPIARAIEAAIRAKAKAKA